MDDLRERATKLLYCLGVTTTEFFSQVAMEHLRTAAEAEREAIACWHDEQAVECEAIAAVNQENDLGADCTVRAQDHREDAATIRARGGGNG